MGVKTCCGVVDLLPALPWGLGDRGLPREWGGRGGRGCEARDGGARLPCRYHHRPDRRCRRRDALAVGARLRGSVRARGRELTRHTLVVVANSSEHERREQDEDSHDIRWW